MSITLQCSSSSMFMILRSFKEVNEKKALDVSITENNIYAFQSFIRSGVTKNIAPG